MANIMKAVGYDVKQYFFVNDLGAQIGLTACVYSRIYPLVEPTLKIDQVRFFFFLALRPPLCAVVDRHGLCRR